MKIVISIVGRGGSDKYVVLDSVQSYAEDPNSERIYLWFENEDKAIKASAILDFIYGKKKDKDTFEPYGIERRADMILLSDKYQISE